MSSTPQEASELAAAEPDFTLSPEQRQELDRRLRNSELHPDAGVPWEVIKARFLAR